MLCSNCSSTTTSSSFSLHPPSPPSSVISAPYGPVPRASAPEIDFAAQIQNIVVKDEKQEKKDNNIGGDTNVLQDALSTVIKNRRNNLHMHDEDNEEEEEDDWDWD